MTCVKRATWCPGLPPELLGEREKPHLFRHLYLGIILLKQLLLTKTAVLKVTKT